MGNQDGFTLIEGVIAIALFSIGILAVGYMHLSAATTNGSAARVNDAYSLAAQKIEDFMALPYDSHLYYSLDNSSDKPGYTITQSVQVEPSINVTPPVVQRIDVTVSWQFRGEPRQLRISHLRSSVPM